MGKLIYATLCSLDGYIEDTHGSFDWAEPPEEVHRYINTLDARCGVMLFGRKLFDIMTFWESEETLKDFPYYIQEYGRVWRKAEKIVYSRTLTSVTSTNTTLRHELDADEIRRLKAERQTDISIGGAELGSAALSQGLVDELYLFINPVIVGGGKPAFRPGPQIKLTLLETKQFAGGIVLLHYSVLS